MLTSLAVVIAWFPLFAVGVVPHFGEVIIPTFVEGQGQTIAFGTLRQADVFQTKLGAAFDFCEGPFDCAGRITHRFDGKRVFQILRCSRRDDISPHEQVTAVGTEHFQLLASTKGVLGGETIWRVFWDLSGKSIPIDDLPLEIWIFG